MSQYVDASTFFVWEDDRVRTRKELEKYERYRAEVERARLELALRAHLGIRPRSPKRKR